MKRSEALQPLSHDHHQGLAFVARLRRARLAEEAPGVWAEAVSAFWRDELVPHFAEEETCVLPVLAAAQPSLADQMRREHRRIEALVEAISKGPAAWSGEDGLDAFADALAAHIRFEEREAFPAVEHVADSGSLRLRSPRLRSGQAGQASSGQAADTLAAIGDCLRNAERRHA